MIIDCDECEMQGTSTCEDCVVTLLLQDTLGPIEVDRDQTAALGVLAEAGIVPELRLVRRASNE